MQFEDIIFGVIAELRNMDHPFIDEWEIEDSCCRKSQVLEEIPRASLLAQLTSQPKLRHAKPPSPNQRHNLIINLTSPTNHQQLKKTPPVANNAPPLPASANETTDAGDHGAQARGSELVDAAPEDDATDDETAADTAAEPANEATLQRAIEEAEQLLEEELAELRHMEPARASGSEDTTSIEKDNKAFAETFVALGAEEPAPRGTTTTNNDRSPVKTRPTDAASEACDGGAGQRVPGEPAAVDNAARVLAEHLAAAQLQLISRAINENPGSATPFCDRYLAGGAEITKPKETPEPRPPPEIAKAKIALRGEYGKSRVPTGPACLRGCARYLVAPVLYPRVSGPGMG